MTWVVIGIERYGSRQCAKYMSIGEVIIGTQNPCRFAKHALNDIFMDSTS